MRQHVNLGPAEYVCLPAAPWARVLTLFEVDHPTTQEWKRADLERLGILIPSNPPFVRRFRDNRVSEGLTVAGFDFQNNLLLVARRHAIPPQAAMDSRSIHPFNA